jgi:DNA-binding response OmpR family regulator
MARLRKKLGDDVRNPRYILTRPGIGYMMVKKA